MDEYFNVDGMALCANTEEETMKEKTFFDKAFDFVKNHKLEIAAGIGLAYLGYKFGVKSSYNTGLSKGFEQGVQEEFERAQNFMADAIAPEVGTHYDVVRTLTKDGYFEFNSSPVVSMSKDAIKSALKESLSEIAIVRKSE